jgi:hypothetical protein
MEKITLTLTVAEAQALFASTAEQRNIVASFKNASLRADYEKTALFTAMNKLKDLLQTAAIV